MIKGKFYFLLFFGILATFHYGLAITFPKPYFNKDLILVYTVLVLLAFIGNTLMYFGTKNKDPNGLSIMFMAFTTIQLLAVLSFSAYLIYGKFNYEKPLVLQFVTLFFLSLLYQCIYFIRLINSNNQQKNT
ncbi:MAG: hypothetical protein ACPGU5_02150 [Lishizhenia sp.]